MILSNESYEDLTEEEKDNVPDDGREKYHATYIRIKRGEDTVLLKSDAMEPEDSNFCRDLSWIEKAIDMAYKYGLEDGKIIK